MNIIQAIVMGFIQGATEFLPISSSGHLVLAENFMKLNLTNSVLFSVILHLGTICAIFIAFYKDIYKLIIEFINMIKDLTKGKISINKNEDRKFIYLILTASVPTAIIGILFKDYFENLYSSPIAVGIALWITGTLLLFIRKYQDGTKTLKTTKYKDALFVGFIQGFAIIPGISRSGSTIFAGLFRGIKKDLIIKFSFFISIPAVLGANLLKFKEINQTMYSEIFSYEYLAGFLTSFLIGFLCIKILIKLLNNSKLHLFAYYCYFIGILAIIFA